MDSNKKIIILDIDGLLNDYPKSFLQWVRLTYGISVPTLAVLKKQDNYKIIKEHYRMSGAKKYSVITDGLNYLLDFLRSGNFYVWIITSRPVLAETVDHTKYWLNKNKIPYDRLDFCRDKKSTLGLKPELFEKIVFAIDDSVEFLRGIEEISSEYEFPLILFTGNHDEEVSVEDLGKRFFVLNRLHDIPNLVKTI
jgi:hypothetical protein